MAEPGPSKNMEWMYKGPSALVDREDYLLGRAVDKSFKLLEAQEKGEPAFSYADEVEKDLTPASIFSSRSGATPVDLIRKIKEDPLYQIEKKEQETLKQLLQNPIKMKQLKKLADEQKVASKSKKSKKKHKKRRSSSSSSNGSDSGKKLDKSTIDKLLAAKLNAFKKKSGKSSSSSSDEEDPRISRDYKSTKDNRSRSSERYKAQSRDNRRDDPYSRRNDDRGQTRNYRSDNFRRPDSRDRDRRDNTRRRSRSRSPRAHSTSNSSSRYQAKPQRKPMSEEEMEKRRREMMENAKVRDDDRKKNVERWKEEQRKEEDELAKQHDAQFIRKHLLSAAESGSVEKRIKANSYNIQKSSSAMNQNFARR